MKNNLQIKENTVESENQLRLSEHVFIKNRSGSGKRIMFVGNSITLHGVKEDIGWHGHWGMAASAAEKDYVHLLMKATDEKTPDAVYCICQVADSEREYKDYEKTFTLYRTARDFNADIIIMRFIENCPDENFDKSLYKKWLDAILDYLNPHGSAKIILTTGFWPHPGDVTTEEYAKEKNLPIVFLGDLGICDDMKAIGLFEHTGVASHPGDLGMEIIAQRIFDQLQKLI